MDEVHIIPTEPEVHEHVESHEDAAQHVIEEVSDSVEHEQHETESHLEHLINSNQEEERWRTTHQSISEMRTELAEVKGLLSNLIPPAPMSPEEPQSSEDSETISEEPTIIEEVSPPSEERKRGRLRRSKRTNH